MTTYNLPTVKTVSFNKVLLNFVDSLLTNVKVSIERKKAVRRLNDLPEYLLQDIGVTREDIAQMSNAKQLSK